MKRNKAFFLFFLLLSVSVSFAQNAGFNAIIGLHAYAAKNGDTLHVCKGGTVTYTNTAASQSPPRWRYSNGTIGNSAGPSLSVNYPDTGSFFTVQTVSASGNKDDSLKVFVAVADQDPALKADFSILQSGTLCANTNFTFDGSASIGNGLLYDWDFGDSLTGTGSPVSHQFLTAVGASGTSTFNVKLTVTDANGCTAESPPKVLTVNKIPHANLINDEANAEYVVYNGYPTFRHCLTLPTYAFIFKNNSSTDSANTKYTFNWGDSSTPTILSTWKKGDTVQHIFKAGNTIVTLTVDGSNGCSATQQFNVYLGSTPGGGLVRPPNTDYCEGTTVKFPVSGVANNPPGTVYVFSVNDGSPEQVFYGPIDTIMHTFNRSSCGTSTDGYPNAFTATLWLKNACDSANSSVNRIHVTGNPKAKILSDTVACINSVLNIFNSSETGSVVTSNGTCLSPSIVAWSIQPATGFSLVNGTDTGSVNGASNDWTKWKAGTYNLSLNFSQPGYYKVTLYLSNKSSCVDIIDSTDIMICVRESPGATIIFDPGDSCTAAILKFKAAPQSSCAGNAYRWDINSSDLSNCSANNIYTFLQGTSATSDSAVIKFEGAARYDVVLNSTAAGSAACPIAKDTSIITIKAPPLVKINTIPSICKNDSIIPTASVTDCYSGNVLTYHWVFPEGLRTESDSLAPGYIPYNETGTKLLTLSVSNSCGTTTDTTSFEVIGNPVADAGADTIICSGEQKTIGKNTGNYTYDWSPKTGLEVYNISQPMITHINNGIRNDTLVYFLTVSGGINCKAYDTVTVVVKPSPLVTIDPARASICRGDSIRLTASGADNYLWSPADYLSSIEQASVLSTPPVTTVYTVTGLLANGCSNNKADTITIYPDAKAAFTPSGLYRDCAGYNLKDVIKVEDYPDRNAEYRWYKNGVLFYTSASPIPPDLLMSAAGDSITIHMVAISLYGCKADTTAPVNFKTSEGITALFTKNSTGGCETQTVTFTNTSSVLDNTASFKWNFGNGDTSSIAQPQTISFTSGPLSRDTTYYIKLIARNSCAIDSTIDSIDILPRPVARFGSDSSTSGCSPFTIKFKNTSAGNPLTYYWDFGKGVGFTTTSDTAVSYTFDSPVLDTFLVTLTAENACGSDTLRLPLVVAPNSISAQVSVFGNDLYGCAPHVVNFVNNTTGALVSNWDYGDNTGEQLPGNIVNVSHNYTDTGTYNVKINFDNGCNKSSVTKQVVIYPPAEAAFNLAGDSSGIICFGTPVRINITKQTGDINRLYWGDNALFYSPPVTSHDYQQLGTYKVQLIAERRNDIGIVCVDTAMQTIVIAAVPKTTVLRDNDVNCITGDTYLRASGGVAYTWTPATSLSNAFVNNPVASPQASMYYHVFIKGNSGCVVHDSVYVKVDFSNPDNAFYMPNAFSPNGDNKNDLFGIKYWGVVTEFDFAVFDRWGHILFHTTNPLRKWDGKFDGRGQDPGAYIYTIRATTNCGKVNRKGSFLLIR